MRSILRTASIAAAAVLLLASSSTVSVEARRHHSARHHAAAVKPHHVASAEEKAQSLANAEYAHMHAHHEACFEGILKSSLDIGEYTPSATPLVMLSPEVSVWSFTDDLHTTDTQHWSGQQMTITGAVRVDGKVYGFLGNASKWFGGATLTQVAKVANPTTTVYSFTGAGITLGVSFSSAVDDLTSEKDLARPYSYVSISVNNTDSQPHSVQVYFDADADWVIDAAHADNGLNIQWRDMTPEAPADWVAHTWYNVDNVPFSVKGDGVKINWGRALMAGKADSRLTHTVGEGALNRRTFSSAGANGSLPAWDQDGTRSFNDRQISSAFQWQFGTLAPKAATGSYFLIGYDDQFSMNYFGEWQKPLWSSQYKDDVRAVLTEGLVTYPDVIKRLVAFDTGMWGTLRAAGGDEYAALTTIAWRQVTAGIKAVYSEVHGESRFYMKEISSDGDVSTVDVIYPAAPFFVAFGPEVLRKIIVPVLDYGLNRTSIAYDLPWAPHHLGAWPVCDITGHQQEQMPMEESGNLLIMLAAVAAKQGGDVAWLAPYWPVLKTWADYLNAALPDPGNQLCTDDFEGPSPHNVNLALKGIVGLGAWSQLLAFNGQTQQSQQAFAQAQGFAAQWLTMSGAGGNSHSKLQFDLPNTWSQKYNMLFHNVLNMTLFGADVMAGETAYYKTKINSQWGLPLDSRGPLTKSDWSAWIASLVPASEEAFSQQIFQTEWNFLTKGPSRGVPFSDFFATDDGHVLGFRARPVQGGIFAKHLIKQGI